MFEPALYVLMTVRWSVGLSVGHNEFQSEYKKLILVYLEEILTKMLGL